MGIYGAESGGGINLPNIEETTRALRKRGYEVSCFETGEEAAQYESCADK